MYYIIILYYIILYYIISYHIFIVLYYHFVLLYYLILYYIIYHIIWYYILHCITLHYITLYYIILYHIILFYTFIFGMCISAHFQDFPQQSHHGTWLSSSLQSFICRSNDTTCPRTWVCVHHCREQNLIDVLFGIKKPSYWTKQKQWEDLRGVPTEFI